MPFQDIDEVSSLDGPRRPSTLSRVLHRMFVEDWNLKLLSLAITLVLWFVVTGQNSPVNTHATVQLKFIRPETLEFSVEPPKSVDVLLTGSKYKLDELNKSALIATIDISDQRAGERVLRLADRAQLELPQGVSVDAFQPSAISIRLEPLVDRQLEVEAKLEGTPAEGYEVYGVRISKTTVHVRGPASNVNALPKAPTESISIAGRHETFTAPNVAIDISDPKIDLRDPSVSVEVEIGERRTEKEFSDVQVVMNDAIPQPDRATVVLYGPRDVLAALKSSDIKVVIPSTGDASKATLQVSADIQNKLSIRAVKPSKFKSGR
ncbi:MAG TPA: CdaR family protein [Pyrinomonadaceae bacterium]|jgi:YbbR domain-containing protein